METQDLETWLRSNLEQGWAFSPSQQEGHLASLVASVLEDYRREGLTTTVRAHAKLASHLVEPLGFNLPIRNGQRVLEAMTQLANGQDIPAWGSGPPFALSQINGFKEKKQRHHYVWQFYLEPWITVSPKRQRRKNDKGQIWCRRRGQNPKPCGTSVIAVRRDFYRLRELTLTDILWLEAWINRCPPPTREMHRKWISRFTDVFVGRRLAEAQGFPATPEFEKEFDVVLSNIEENYHAQIETLGARFLHSLRRGNLSFFDEPGIADFCLFFGIQLLRGPGMATHLRELTNKREPDDSSERCSEAAVGALRIILGESTGAKIYVSRNRSRISLLRAPTGSEFITGDQPVVITRHLPLALYYPVSPQIALLLETDHFKPDRLEVHLDNVQVLHCNKMIMSVAFEQIYGACEAALEGPFDPQAPSD